MKKTIFKVIKYLVIFLILWTVYGIFAYDSNDIGMAGFHEERQRNHDKIQKHIYGLLKNSSTVLVKDIFSDAQFDYVCIVKPYQSYADFSRRHFGDKVEPFPYLKYSKNQANWKMILLEKRGELYRFNETHDFVAPLNYAGKESICSDGDKAVFRKIAISEDNKTISFELTE